MWKAVVVVALGSHVAVADPKPGSCEAVAKQHAKAVKLAAWRPAGCTAKGGALAPRLVTGEAEARAHVDCAGGKLAFDFTKHALVVTARSMSPAQVGLDIYDDGKVVTFVSRDRTPCKGDPRPMPGPTSTLLLQVGAGPRTFAEASCTVPSTCAK